MLPGYIGRGSAVGRRQRQGGRPGGATLFCSRAPRDRGEGAAGVRRPTHHGCGARAARGVRRGRGRLRRAAARNQSAADQLAATGRAGGFGQADRKARRPGRPPGQAGGRRAGFGDHRLSAGATRPSTGGDPFAIWGGRGGLLQDAADRSRSSRRASQALLVPEGVGSLPGFATGHRSTAGAHRQPEREDRPAERSRDHLGERAEKPLGSLGRLAVGGRARSG